MKRSENKTSLLNRYQAGGNLNKDESSNGLNRANVNNYVTSYSQPKTLRSSDNFSHTSAFTSSANESSVEEEWKKFAREAGINLEFPGISEQKAKYKVPEKENYKNFLINPQPDLAKFKRPFSMPVIEKKQTEYQFRYKFPDSKDIDKFPWIKKY